MGKGRILMPVRQIVHVLDLPRVTRIKQVSDSELLGVLEIVVEHPGLPNVSEGEQIPLYKIKYDHSCTVPGRRHARFVDWGDPISQEDGGG